MFEFLKRNKKKELEQEKEQQSEEFIKDNLPYFNQVIFQHHYQELQDLQNGMNLEKNF